MEKRSPQTVKVSPFKKKQAGTSLLEVITAAVLLVLVLFVATMAFISGMMGWARGEADVSNTTSVQHALRFMSGALREARVITIAADGLSITYQRPAVNGSGDFIIPPVPEPIVRRFFLEATAEANIFNLVHQIGAARQIVCRRVIVRNPRTGPNWASWQPYRLFIPEPGGVVQEIRIQIATYNPAAYSENRGNYGREKVFLPNVPVLGA